MTTAEHSALVDRAMHDTQPRSDLLKRNDVLGLELERVVEALELISSKSMCECWDVPSMGSDLPYVWKGCLAHHSPLEGEWCLTCIAHQALERLGRLAKIEVAAGQEKE